MLPVHAGLCRSKLTHSPRSPALEQAQPVGVEWVGGTWRRTCPSYGSSLGIRSTLLHFSDIWGTFDSGRETGSCTNRKTKNPSRDFSKKNVLEWKLQRVSFDCVIFANEMLLVVEFGRGEVRLILVGGISTTLRNPLAGKVRPRRSEKKST